MSKAFPNGVDHGMLVPPCPGPWAENPRPPQKSWPENPTPQNFESPPTKSIFSLFFYIVCNISYRKFPGITKVVILTGFGLSRGRRYSRGFVIFITILDIIVLKNFAKQYFDI